MTKAQFKKISTDKNKPLVCPRIGRDIPLKCNQTPTTSLHQKKGTFPIGLAFRERHH